MLVKIYFQTEKTRGRNLAHQGPADHDGWPQFFGRAEDQVLKFKLITKSYVNVTITTIVKTGLQEIYNCGHNA